MPLRRALAALLLAGGGALPAAVPPPAGAAPAACSAAPSPGVAVPRRAPRDPLISDLGLDRAWTLSTGTGVTVGIVDTGVDPASPKLAGAVALGSTYRPVDTPAVYARAADGRVDCSGHGTQVAGIVAGRTDAGDDRVSGVAPSAGVYPVAIQGDIAQAPAALLAAAIRDAAQHAQVINLSFAQSSDNAEIRAAVRYALGRDVVVVAAAANDTSSGGGRSYPAAYPGVLGVAAVDADGVPPSTGPSGDWISLAAPADDLTTVTRGGSGYVTVSGTSFAAAIVSGAAALVRQRFPALSAAQVRDRLERTATPPGSGSRDRRVGFGVVDPYAALTTASSGAAPRTVVAPGPVAVAPVRRGDGDDRVAGVIGVAAVLLVVALVVGLGTLSVRGGRRRGWHAGRRPGPSADARVARSHPAELDRPPGSG